MYQVRSEENEAGLCSIAGEAKKGWGERLM